MLTKDVETMAGAAQGKADICEHYPVKFFIRAIMAGFFIVVATILSNVSAAVLYSTYPQFGKLLGAFLFSIAIVLIVFIGGELFTGNNMTMSLPLSDFMRVPVRTARHTQKLHRTPRKNSCIGGAESFAAKKLL